MTTLAKITVAQQRALDLLALAELHRVADGWANPDGDWVALPCMKALRRKGLVVRTRDLLRCRLTTAGRALVQP
jgi:hypothetical protein